MFRRAMVELAKLHRAAGAKEILTFFQRPALSWREGEDFDAFLAAIERGSLAPNDIAAFSAHQMGSCRMGSDPLTRWPDGRGQLHDTAGVWIGDASAFPTAPGVNPMISIMSLAHSTAGEHPRRLAAAGAARAAPQAALALGHEREREPVVALAPTVWIVVALTLPLRAGAREQLVEAAHALRRRGPRRRRRRARRRGRRCR